MMVVNYSVSAWNNSRDSTLHIYLNNSGDDYMVPGMSEPRLREKPWPLLRQSPPMLSILTLAYVVVFVLSIVNNSLVVSVVHRNPQMRTVTNYFIANLAVADILVSILVLPITLLSNLFEGKCLPYIVLYSK